MKPLDVCFGMIKVGTLVLIGMTVLVVLGPTAGAVGEYLIRPHRLNCNGYSARIPMNWKLSRKNCDATVLLERRNGLLFDPNSDHQLIFMRSFEKEPVSIDREETEFRGAHPGQRVFPLRINDAFSQCLRADDESDGSWISVDCVDHSSRVEFTFIGPAKDLNEAVSLITLHQ